MNFGARLPEPCPQITFADGTVFLSEMVRAAPGGGTDLPAMTYAPMRAGSTCAIT